MLPETEHGNAVYESVELPDVFPHLLCASRKGNTSPRVVWSVVRCGLVKGTKKLPEGGDQWLRGPAVAQAAHSHQRTKVRRTMTTGIPGRAARCEAARALAPAIEETVGEATAAPVRSRRPKRHAEEGARQESSPKRNSLLSQPSPISISGSCARSVCCCLEQSPDQRWLNRDFGRWLWPGCHVGSLSAVPNPKGYARPFLKSLPCRARVLPTLIAAWAGTPHGDCGGNSAANLLPEAASVTRNRGSAIMDSLPVITRASSVRPAT